MEKIKYIIFLSTIFVIAILCTFTRSFCYAGVFELGVGWYGLIPSLTSDAGNNFGYTAENLKTSAFDFSYKNFDIGLSYILKSGIGFGGEIAFNNTYAKSYNANDETTNSPISSFGKKTSSAPFIVYSQNTPKEIKLDGSNKRVDLSDYQQFTKIERTNFIDAYDFFINASVLNDQALSDAAKGNEVQLGYIIRKYTNMFYSLNVNYNFVRSIIATFAELALGIAPTSINITDIFSTIKGSDIKDQTIYLVDNGLDKKLKSNNFAYRIGGGLKVDLSYFSPVIYIGYFHAFEKKISQGSKNEYIPAINNFSNLSSDSINIGYSDIVMKLGVNFYF